MQMLSEDWLVEGCPEENPDDEKEEEDDGPKLEDLEFM
jgi:hypothetical protein